MRRIHRPSPAVVLAMIALTVSLTGTGFAFGRNAGDPATAKAAAAVTWHNLTLKNGWAYAGYNSYHAAWFKDADGFVHLRGSLFDGTSGEAAFRLPSSARPNKTVWLQVYAINGSSGGLEILPSGKAFPFDDNSDVNVIGYTSLDGLTFAVP
jgi:hypothetical protein